ncbi:MAG: hypothetical protein IKF59_04740 [Lachnospiraceae bacterium]|nr:hypothetical protein [Lachnospiraceae bacterium]
MSNTVKIKNKKKKNEVKVNYKLWAIIFGIFVAVIVVGSVWASFHWGVGMGTIGDKQMSSEDAAAAASEIAASAATDAVVLTPEQLEQMGLTVNGQQEGAEEAAEGEAEAAGEEAAGEDAGAAEDAGADGAEAEDAGSN